MGYAISDPLQNPSGAWRGRDVRRLRHDESVSETTTAETARTPVRRFVDRHLALLGAVLLIVIATLRVFFVAAFDMPTALAVLAIVDRTQLLTSSVLTGLVLVLPLIFIQPATRKWLLAGNATGAPFSTQMRTAVLWIPLLAIVLTTFTLPLIAGWFTGWIIYFFVHKWARKRALLLGQEPPRKNAPMFDANFNNWIVATLIGWMFLTVLYQPWLAREAVELSDGERVVGSVVGTQGDMTLLLGAAGAGARWVATDEIDSRDVCRDRPEWYSATLPFLLPREGVSCKAILDEHREDAK